MNISSNRHPRLILSEIRGGDFAHAGDSDSIEMVLDQIFRIKNPDFLTGKKILDAGCGFGGTADFIRKRTLSNVYGIDTDKAAVDHGSKKYPDCNFYLGNLLTPQISFKNIKFDMIFMFNVLYSVDNKIDAIKSFCDVLNMGGIISIFDYFDFTSGNFKTVPDLDNKEISPVNLDSFLSGIKEFNFKALLKLDMSNLYLEWYDRDIDKLNEKIGTISLNESFQLRKIIETFSSIRDLISQKKIGGGLILLSK